MSPTSFDDLGQRERRRLLVRSVLRIIATIAALLVLYAVIPVPDETGARALVELVLGLLAFAAMLAWQVRSIVAADHPELRAVEALALAATVVIVVFAFTYLSLSRSDPSNFSEPLDRVGAMYFTVTVLSTVGFGDIVGRTDLARLLVTGQIVLDTILVVALARTLVFAARTGVRRKQDAAAREGTDARGGATAQQE